MTEDSENDFPDTSHTSDNKQKDNSGSEDIEVAKKQISELNDKFVRLYADFENYKRIATRSREEQLKYANENLIKDLLTVIDHLELALQHSTGGTTPNSLSEGVELTLKEFKTVLERYGVAIIESLGKPFDPSLHHAMTQIESDSAEENTVIKEFRKGYIFKDRIIRASLVGVAKGPASESSQPSTNE